MLRKNRGALRKDDVFHCDFVWRRVWWGLSLVEDRLTAVSFTSVNTKKAPSWLHMLVQTYDIPCALTNIDIITTDTLVSIPYS